MLLRLAASGSLLLLCAQLFCFGRSFLILDNSFAPDLNIYLLRATQSGCMSFAGNAAVFALCLYCSGISVCAVMSLIVRLLSVGEPLSCKICDRRQS